MYKNQLQELAQRSCFSLPSYSCIREGPDHAPRFKAKVNFNGEMFESPTFCSTVRQSEHAAAEVALKMLSMRGPSRVLAARVLDETGVYKNLLQETAHRAGLKLPVYTTVRSGPRHFPVFTCTVELGGMCFIGEPARTKKQAQKNVAMTAWFSLKNMSQSSSSSYYSSLLSAKDEQEQVTVARYLADLHSAETNKFIQREHLHERLDLGPLRRDVSSYEVGRSLYHARAYSHFSPELAMAPTSVPGPQFFPFVRSIIGSDHIPYFLAKGQESIPLVPRINPFFYLSDRSMPVPVRSISQVSIEEIDEETQVEEEWLGNNANTSGWKLNFHSNLSGTSPTEVLHCADSLSAHSRLMIQEFLQGKDVKNSESAPYTRNSSQKDIPGNEEFGWIPPGFIQHGHRAKSTDEKNSSPQNPSSSSFVWSNARPRNPPTDSSPRMERFFAPPLSAAPVAVRNVCAVSQGNIRAEVPNFLISPRIPTRTGVSVGSARPRIRRMPRASSMAPAVQIRTVVPVCSAPATRKMAAPSLEGIVSWGEKKTAEVKGGDVLAASPEFGNLQL